MTLNPLPVIPDAATLRQHPPGDPAGAEAGGQLRAELIRARLLTPTDVDHIEDPGWLIDRYIPAGGLATIFGRPGSYKTFLALDWACHVATGTWWHSRHRTNPGAVLYVMAEGVGGLRRRKQAWEAHNRVHLADYPIRWYPQPLNLLDPEWAEGLAQVAGEMACTLIVIDTVARSMPGGDENTSRDMGALIGAADRCRAATAGAVILVHHTPLDGSRLRGHSSLEGAVDTNIGVDSDGTTIKVTVEKQKDAEPPEPLLLHPEPAGESIVLRPGSGNSGGLPPAALEMLRTLEETDLGEGVTSSQWMVSGMVSKASFHRTVKRLLEDGWCHVVSGERGTHGARYGLTDQGKREVTR